MAERPSGRLGRRAGAGGFSRLLLASAFLASTFPAGAQPTGDPGAVALPDLIVDLFPDPAPGGGSGGTGEPPPGEPPPGQPPSDPAPPPPAGQQGDLAEAFVPDEVLVTVDGGPGTVAAVAAAFGLEVRAQRRSALLGATLARLGIPDGRPVGAVLAALAADGRTGRRAPNHVYVLQDEAAAESYAFRRIALDPASADGGGVRVAVIDTGVDASHPALKGVIAAQFDAMPGVPAGTSPSGRDHGTAVDGLIAGVAPLRGIAPGAAIYHARAFEDGRSTADAVLAALDWAAGQDVRIVNMSFAGPKNELLGIACRNARAEGIVLVAAAGNNGPGAPHAYPAAFPGVIAVTATDGGDALMPQANRGAYVYVAAPGVDLVAPVAGGQDLVTGTSFAAAVFAGALAGLFHDDPALSADRVENAVAASAVDLGPPGRDDDFGYGLVDAAAARAAAK